MMSTPSGNGLPHLLQEEAPPSLLREGAEAKFVSLLLTNAARPPLEGEPRRPALRAGALKAQLVSLGLCGHFLLG